LIDFIQPERRGDMLLALKVLLTVFAVIFLMLLILLVVPLFYEFSLTGENLKIKFQIACRSFLGTIFVTYKDNHTGIELHILNHPVHSHPKKKTSAQRNSVPKPRRILSSFLLSEAIKDTGLLKHCMNFIIAVWKIIKPRHLTAIARIGFSEPHYTGWVMAAAALLQAENNRYTIHIEGNWVEPCLDGEILVAGKIISARILWEVLKFLFSSEVISYYRSRRKRIIAVRTQTA
jgi:hypothetical protein